MSAEVKGVPARVKVNLPVWQAREIVRDIDRVMESLPSGDDGIFPLTLHDFGEALQGALRETDE